MKNKVFVSYRADDEGSRYKNLLVAWSENDRFFPEISFHDTSVGTSINSVNATYIKSVIKDKIQKSDIVLCLVGRNTSDSDWVNWEIETAYQLNKKIVAVKIDRRYDTPRALYRKNVDWAFVFSKEAILRVLI
ncbi:TIR domain-containing protein [Streptococcus equinus]|uniref:TIR domain-containing protein n=1 Tax=Streptococcus equinus TaxID=1335 RepID=UPI00051B579A|nr:TIR domain-containing protein [Streptococcus equinus]